jgi:hypothetical protein
MMDSPTRAHAAAAQADIQALTAALLADRELGASRRDEEQPADMVETSVPAAEPKPYLRRIDLFVSR